MSIEKIKVIVADDMEDIQNYFKMIIDRESDMKIVGIASNSKEAYQLVSETRPDVVIMDIQMETEYAGLEVIGKIKTSFPDIKIIVLTMHDDDELMFEAFGLGAVDYIIKSSSVSQILDSIRAVYSDNFALSIETTKKLLNKITQIHKTKISVQYLVAVASQLTKSEIEILKGVHSGFKYVDLANQRCVEIGTIRVQVNKILKKFQAESMKGLISDLESINFFDMIK